LTNANSVLSVLQANWGLTGSLAGTKIYFSPSQWFDAAHATQPQVTVSDRSDVVSRYFGGSIRYSYARFNVNVWVQVPRGNLAGTVESQQAEDMRNEVAKIIMDKRTAISPFVNIVPEDEGVPLHEVEGAVPRLLRYQISLIGAHQQ
jgi:hypothetical protein